jgi:hypothetical protein
MITDYRAEPSKTPLKLILSRRNNPEGQPDARSPCNRQAIGACKP